MRATTAALAASLFLLEANGVALAAGPWRANQENTRGWMLMSPEERIAHQAKIRGFTNYEDCHAYQLAHHRLMQERAAQLGLKLPERGRDACAHLRPSPDPRN
nr:hypothetical protein [Candidatus Rhodoblastus alkanivorans]